MNTITVACPEVMEAIKNSLHMKFFRFCKTYLSDKWGSNTHMISAGSYPLYYFLKGNADTPRKKVELERGRMRDFEPNDFDLWTNLEYTGQVLDMLMEYLGSNQDLKTEYIRISTGQNKYSKAFGNKFIKGVVTFVLESKRSTDKSIPIQIICWNDKDLLKEVRITPQDFMDSVLDRFDISICRIGWFSPDNLVDMYPAHMGVPMDIEAREFSITLKRYEDMSMVTERIMKYTRRGFRLCEMKLYWNYWLRDMGVANFVVNVRDVSDNDMGDTRTSSENDTSVDTFASESDNSIVSISKKRSRPRKG